MSRTVHKVIKKPEETVGQAYARALMDPSTGAGVAIGKSLYRGDEAKGFDVGDLIEALRAQAKEISGNDFTAAEGMLIAQANTLNHLFVVLMDKALAASKADSGYAYELHMRFALKAQSQCRTTLESLSEIKNPKSVAFIRQANVAQNQQVNNGVEPCVRGEIETRQNELRTIEHDQQQLLDTRAKGREGRTDPALETVDAIHRPANRSRKAESKPQRLERRLPGTVARVGGGASQAEEVAGRIRR